MENWFSCEGKQSLRRMQNIPLFPMNMEIATNFEALKLG